MDLNKEELTIGAVFGLTFVFNFGWLVIPVLVATSLLWALGGRYGGSIRRYGCSGVVVAVAFLLSHSWWVFLSLPLGVAVLSIGYGIPSTQPPDEGSALGKFWFKINPEVANVMTRLTIYVLLALVFIPVYIS
jgi:hypothetical protein